VKFTTYEGEMMKEVALTSFTLYMKHVSFAPYCTIILRDKLGHFYIQYEVITL